MSKKLSGTLTYWFENETGVLLWLFLEDDLAGLEGVHLLQDGDWLTVFDELEQVVFSGYIETMTIEEQQTQYALGFRVYWVQCGWQPDNWGRLFVRYHQEGELPLSAELIKRTLH